jgi:amiloride-sensitive sodium channel
VHVFIPTDYPDKSSGNLIENIADIGTENFFEVVPTTVAAVPDVMNYPVDKRNCLFQVEQLTQFGVYSQSDCFVDCRIKSMMTLCECIPFTIPLSDDRTVCTLRDLPCLDKYKSACPLL